MPNFYEKVKFFADFLITHELKKGIHPRPCGMINLSNIISYGRGTLLNLIDRWTVVDAAKSSGHDQNPSWPELKLKDGQRAGSKKEYYFVTTTYQDKKGKTKTEKYNMDFSEWKKLKKGEEIELKINFNGFAEINNKK